MPPARPALRIALVLLASAAAVAVLAGCSGTGKASPSASPSGGATSTSAAGDPGSGASAAPTPTPTPTPTPVTLTQSQVWTPQQVYDFNPNYTPDPNYSLQSGSAAQQLKQLAGVSYGWIDQTSNNKIEVAVAHPSSKNFQEFSGQVAASSQPVPIDNAPAGTVSYFNVANGVGTLQIFTNNGYWVVIDSATFIEPGDSYQIASDVMANLK